jgi:protocatechuate 3,4-dioxygenase beta subunit
MIYFTNKNNVRILCGRVFDFNGHPVSNTSLYIYK